MAQAKKKAKKRVVIIVEGGLVQSVYAPRGTEIEVMDFDGDSADCRDCRLQDRRLCKDKKGQENNGCDRFEKLNEADIARHTRGLQAVY